MALIFVAILTTINWLKLAQPADPKFLTSISMIGALLQQQLNCVSFQLSLP